MRFKSVFNNLELEGQGRGIIMGVTRPLLLGPFYSIQANFPYFFAHDCSIGKFDFFLAVLGRNRVYRAMYFVQNGPKTSLNQLSEADILH